MLTHPFCVFFFDFWIGKDHVTESDGRKQCDFNTHIHRIKLFVFDSWFIVKWTNRWQKMPSNTIVLMCKRLKYKERRTKTIIGYWTKRKSLSWVEHGFKLIEVFFFSLLLRLREWNDWINKKNSYETQS